MFSGSSLWADSCAQEIYLEGGVEGKLGCLSCTMVMIGGSALPAVALGLG